MNVWVLPVRSVLLAWGVFVVGAGKMAAAPHALLTLGTSLSPLVPLAPLASPSPLAPLAPPAPWPLTPPARPPTNPDSTDILDRARQALSRFQRVRVRHLSWTFGWGGGDCDERLGRMCLRHGEGDWLPTPDPPDVIAAREQLLDTLATLHALIPGDRWIAGQRVRTLGQAGRWDEALGVAGACVDPEGWWCGALEGVSLHGLQRFPEAQESFDRALAIMPTERAREWRSPAPVLDRIGRRLLGDSPESEREGWVEQVWSLSDPLFMVPGNDRLTEHLARHVMVRVNEHTRNLYGMAWGRDLAELLVRYGWEVGWERSRASSIDLSAVNVVGHQHPASQHFVVPGEFLEGSSDRGGKAWDLDPLRPRSTYAPLYAPDIAPLSHQLGVFRREGDLLVLASFAADMPDSLTSEPSAVPDRAGLFLWSVTDSLRSIVQEQGGDEGVLRLRGPAGRYIVGVEVYRPSHLWASRARVGVERAPWAPGTPALSDLILLSPDGASPATLEEAEPRLLPTTVLAPGQAVLVAWELYGLRPVSEVVSFRLTLRPEGRSFFRRAGQWLRIVGRSDPVSVEWEEQGPRDLRPFFRSLRLQVPGLDAGDYVLTVEVRLSGRTPMRTTRRVTVRPEGDR